MSSERNGYLCQQTLRPKDCNDRSKRYQLSTSVFEPYTVTELVVLRPAAVGTMTAGHTTKTRGRLSVVYQRHFSECGPALLSSDRLQPRVDRWKDKSCSVAPLLTLETWLVGPAHDRSNCVKRRLAVACRNSYQSVMHMR